MRIPTITVYKDDEAVVINKSDLDKWKAKGFSDKPGTKKSLTKKDLEAEAKENGLPIYGKSKADLMEVLGYE